MLPDLFHAVEIWGEATMTTEDFLINYMWKSQMGSKIIFELMLYTIALLIAATGRQLKQSVNIFHSSML